MKLFKRNYHYLTDHEKSIYDELKEKEIIHNGKFKVRKSLFHSYPKAARHFISLFPNNYLDILELKDTCKLNEIAQTFEVLLRSKTVTERKIMTFIKSNEAYFIIGSILKSYYHFGHHDAFLFPEFTLGTSLRVDYLLVGRSSGGWEYVFVELESPTGRVTNKNGDFGDVFRKGYNQIKDWDTWLDANFFSLKEVFKKMKNENINLPDEFITYDKTRINYCLIAGMRNDFSTKTYRIRREMKKNNINVLHYENLVESAFHVIGKETY